MQQDNSILSFRGDIRNHPELSHINICFDQRVEKPHGLGLLQGRQMHIFLREIEICPKIKSAFYCLHMYWFHVQLLKYNKPMSAATLERKILRKWF